MVSLATTAPATREAVPQVRQDKSPTPASSSRRNAVPTISRFHGIMIQMHWNEHGPPHFHALYSGQRVALSISDLRVLYGELPRRALGLVRQWAVLHRTELLENWELCRQETQPRRIEPLA